MAFRFHKASCVVVGTFNIYIFHPQWFARHKIFEEGMEVGFETNLTRPGFRFRFPKSEATWSVAPDRLVIETEEPGCDCGARIAHVLRILPETPLVAIGNNVHYQADLSERETLSEAIRTFPQTESPTPGQPVVQRTFHVGIKRSEYETVNLQIAIKEDSLELTCNVHRELGNRKDFNEAAIAAAERFFEDRAESKSLAQHFLGTAIDYAPDST